MAALRLRGALTALRNIVIPKRFETNASTVVLAEEKIASLLRERFAGATFIQVTDVSGGCGAMFEVSIEAADFKGLSVVKQHRLVNEVLKNEIKAMHGIRIQTSAPADS